jgi:hypothetical protein
MKTFSVNINFILTDEFMQSVPEHRTYINMLMNTHVIESYAVSMKSQRAWIIINAASKKEVKQILSKSPLHKFWTYDIDELFLYDSQSFRLPRMELN